MASASRIFLVAFLLATASTMAVAQKAAAPAKAKAAPAAPVADAPGAATADGTPPTDPIAIMKKAGGFTKFCDLLEQTRVDTQLKAQLTDSYNGLTIFAPTDAAFDALKAGTLNGLSNQDQIQMMLYCVLPRFYSLSMLGTLGKEKINTQASGHTGPYRYTIKPSGNNVNVSTGVKGNNMLLNSVVSKDFPLSIYSVDKVPLPYELFGPQPPTPAPAPAPAPSKSKPKKKKKSGIADPPTEESDDDSTAADAKSAASSVTGRWVTALGVLATVVLGGAF